MLLKKSDIFKEFSNFQKFMGENFPLSIYLSDPQEATSVHQHDFVELALVLKGTGRHEGEGIDCIVSRGDILVIPRGCRHRYFDVAPDFAVMNILFLPESLPLPRLDIALLPGFSALFSGKALDNQPYVFFHSDRVETEFLLEAAQELYRESEERTPGCHFIILGLFMTLLGKLVRIYSKGNKLSGKLYISTAGVIAWLNHHYRESVRIDELCRIAGMSRASLMRNFRRSTGTTPLKYQLSLRIAEAVQLLRTTPYSLAEIASRTGFDDANYFGRCFRKIAGTAPGIFRKMQHAEADNQSPAM